MIPYHPDKGTIVICDFNGLKTPEMIKRRPVIILSPQIQGRKDLCTIVPLSSKEPKHIKSYHYKLATNPPLPPPYDNLHQWVKGDMLYTVSLNRLFLPRQKHKDANGKRIYDIRTIDKADFIKIQECVLHGIGLTSLTKYL